LVGSTGKTTVWHVLKDPTYTGEIQLFASTRSPSLCPFTVEYKEQNYNINIIDTSEFFEQYEKVEDIRENVRIREVITTCLQNEITKIHAILFVCNYVAGIIKEDILAIKDFINLFSGAQDKVVMLITRGEDYDVEYKKSLEDQIKKQPELRELVDLIGSKIFFTGTLSKNDYEFSNSESFAKKLQNICQMRTCIFQYIFSLEQPAQLQHLEYFKIQANQAALLEEENKKLKQIIDSNNTTVEDVKKARQRQAEVEKKFGEYCGFTREQYDKKK